MEKTYFFIQCEKWNDIKSDDKPKFCGEVIENIKNVSHFYLLNRINTDKKVEKQLLNSLNSFIIKKAFDEIIDERKELKEKMLQRGKENFNDSKRSLHREVRKRLDSLSHKVSEEAKTIESEIRERYAKNTIYFFLHGKDFLEHSVSHLSMNSEQKKKVVNFEELASDYVLIDNIHLLILQHEPSCKIYSSLVECLKLKNDKKKLFAELAKISNIFDADDRGKVIEDLLNCYGIKNSNKIVDKSEEEIIEECKNMLI